MKKILIAVAAAAMFTSCGADQATVDKMATEICAAMELYDESNPMSLVDAASSLQDIASNETEYGSVSEDQLKTAMETQCPEGHRKFTSLSEGAN